MSDFFDSLELDLVAAARRPRRSRPNLVAVLIPIAATALAVLLVLTLRPGDQEQPGAGRDLIFTRHTDRVLDITVPDPDGGLPWGLRAVGAREPGFGCVTAGRKKDGQIGTVSARGVFRPDPLNLARNGFGCLGLDGSNRLFASYSGDRLDTGGKRRTIYFGLLGPQATRVEYDLGGRTLSQRPGEGGAYLLVTRAPQDGIGSVSGGGGNPGHGPFRRIDFRSAPSCIFRGGSVRNGPIVGGAHTCPNRGFTPIPTPRVTEADVRSPIRVHLGRVHGRRQVLVTFTARVALPDLRTNYLYEFQRPSQRASRSFSPGSLRKTVRAGQRITLQLGLPEPGLYTGSIRYQPPSSRYPANLLGIGPPGGLLVGRFRIRLP